MIKKKKATAVPVATDNATLAYQLGKLSGLVEMVITEVRELKEELRHHMDEEEGNIAEQEEKITAMTNCIAAVKNRLIGGVTVLSLIIAISDNNVQEWLMSFL